MMARILGIRWRSGRRVGGAWVYPPWGGAAGGGAGGGGGGVSPRRAGGCDGGRRGADAGVPDDRSAAVGAPGRGLRDCAACRVSGDRASQASTGGIEQKGGG